MTLANSDGRAMPQTCDRCGDKLDPESAIRRFQRWICEGCQATSGGDPIPAFREHCERRLPLAVAGPITAALLASLFLGIAALSIALEPGGVLGLGTVLVVFSVMALVGLAIATGLRRPGARRLSIAIWPLICLLAVGFASTLTANGYSYPMSLGPIIIMAGALLTLISLAARDPSTLLAFREPVEDADVERVWQREVGNPAAAASRAVGLLSLLIPVIAPVGLAAGLYALRRVDLERFPPVDGRGDIAVGIRASALGVLVGVLVGTLYTLQ